MSAEIKHVFVLAMENRSFDHLFAFSGIAGLSQPDPGFGMTSAATDQAPIDPEHEYEDVQLQIAGDPPMSGFAPRPYGNVSMAGFPQGAVPVLRNLAQQFLLFDNWFSSMPGPTWPNRFFIHAASSGGLDNSPSSVTSVSGAMIDSLSFDFENGTIFQHLQDAGRKWRVYHDDLFPQVLAVKEMIDPFRLNTAEFSWLQSDGVDCFSRDLNAGYDVDYTFIEPDYGLITGGFSKGNCQHPTGSLAAGEAFIKYVYETIRNSAVWANSLLIITYDEHGGFFDHMPPPVGVPPGDDARNHGRAENPMDCDFDRLGVRVPAVAISPWIAAGGLGSQVFAGQKFDHTAIISTVRDLSGLSAPLTNRDKSMPSIAKACALSEQRTDIASLLGAASSSTSALTSSIASPTSGAPSGSGSAALSDGDGSGLPDAPDRTTEAFARIAVSLDLALAQAENVTPVAATHPLFAAADSALSMPPGRGEVGSVPPGRGEGGAVPPVEPVKSRRSLLADYMQAVSVRRQGLRPPVRA